MTGLARWVFEDTPEHARLLSEGWEQTALQRYIFGSGTAVLMILMEARSLVVLTLPHGCVLEADHHVHGTPCSTGCDHPTVR